MSNVFEFPESWTAEDRAFFLDWAKEHDPAWYARVTAQLAATAPEPTDEELEEAEWEEYNEWAKEHANGQTVGATEGGEGGWDFEPELNATTTEDDIGKKHKHTHGLTAYQGGGYAQQNGLYAGKCGSFHDGSKPVEIGGCPVWLAAEYKIPKALPATMDYLCPLNGNLPDMPFGSWAVIVNASLVDRGGVPEEWKEFIERIAQMLRDGKRILAWCTGSHGRTGCFGASLIAVMEPEIADPIAEIRKRHCKEAVESRKQAIAIFALKGQPLPAHYEKEFHDTTAWSGGASAAPKNIDKMWKFPLLPELFEALQKAYLDFRIDGWQNHAPYGDPLKFQIYVDWDDNNKDVTAPVDLAQVLAILEKLPPQTLAAAQTDLTPTQSVEFIG